MKLLSSIMIFLFSAGFLMAQKSISGTVKDDQGEVVIGANVVEKGTTNGTVTDLDGKFSFQVADDATTIIISYVGYSPQELEITGSSMDVTLSEGVNMEKVVVTALGVQRSEKALGYAIQEVSGDEMARSNTTNFVNALNGKVAGLQVTSSSGAAGASSRVVLRGQTSLNGNNQALIVVDGVRVNNSETRCCCFFY